MTPPDISNRDQYAAWNGLSAERWIANADQRDGIYAALADVLLDAAALRPGDAVLDIGCGCGGPTLAAAARVVPDGIVRGIDLSRPMLDLAIQRATRHPHLDVRFEQGDVQTHPLPTAAFDVAISRFGTMFFADPVAAFANVARALRPGGRLCLATWQPLAANDWLVIPGAALLRYGSMPVTADGPGMFAQSDPDRVTAVLDAAGFDGIELTPVSMPLTLGADPAEACDYLADTGPARAVLETIPEPGRPAALDAVRAVLADHQGPGGIQLDAAVWIVTATRPRPTEIA